MKVRGLAFGKSGNNDFGIGTSNSREPPSDDKWKELFSAL